MIRQKPFLSAIALCLLVASACPAVAGPLVLSGSTTVQKRILEPAQKALEKKTGVKLELRGVGSLKGFKELVRGSANAALLSAPLAMVLRDQGLPDDGTYQEHIILQDAIVPIVHPVNPVGSLSMEQITGIQTGKIANWSEVGGKDERIVVIVPPRSSGTRKYLQEAVLDRAEFAESAYAAMTTREEIVLVGRSLIATGLLSEGFVKMDPGKVKVVKAPAIKRPLSIVTRGAPEGDLLKVITFLRSKGSRKLFK